MYVHTGIFKWGFLESCKIQKKNTILLKSVFTYWFVVVIVTVIVVTVVLVVVVVVFKVVV